MGHAITVKGQVTIPKPLRDHLGLKPGDEVAFALEEDGRVVLRRVEPATVDYRSRLARVAGTFRMPEGMSRDDFLRMTRGERDDL